MNRIAVCVLLVAASLAGACPGLRSGVVFAMSLEAYHTKALPHSVDYPMIIPGPYPGAGNDSYAASFGTVRFLKGVVNSEYEATIKEALHFNELYGTFGVLGRGEEVFTERAARFRKAHQGR